MPTIDPMALAIAMTLIATCTTLGLLFVVVGACIVIFALSTWVGELLPGRGHCLEPLAAPARRAKPVTAELKAVEHIRPGMPGYRARLPEAVHPTSAGI